MDNGRRAQARANGQQDNARNNGIGGRRGVGGGHAPVFEQNNTDTLLVVATLVTALSYQLGTNIPGGYWQDDGNDDHIAGDPIMRDKHRMRYWLFMAASWASFGSSTLLTLGLLTGVPARSRRSDGGVMAVLTFGISFRRLDRLNCWFHARDPAEAPARGNP